MGSRIPYVPLDVPKPFAPKVWIVDGPEIDMHYLRITLPLTTRMTVARLPAGRLWVHSPVAWNDGLATALGELGGFEQCLSPGRLLTELDFFHRSWRTLIP